MNSSLFDDKERILDRIRTTLGQMSVNYRHCLDTIADQNRKGARWRAAAVLLPLYFKPAGESGNRHDEVVLQLIKRSAAVTQGGDISAPGGMLSPRIDGFLKSLLMLGVIPALRGDARRNVRKKGPREYSAVALFLANALRESWEEIHLNPCNVEFLGALPTQNLILFTRTIFPLVGKVKRQWAFRPNAEVDKVIEIPLHAFFNAENYGIYCIHSNTNGEESYFESPCFICRDEDGVEEILWGATLRIVTQFLEYTFDFQAPVAHATRMVKKTLYPEYMTGNGDR